MRKLLLFLMLLSSVAFGQLHKSPEGPNRWVIWMPLTQTQIDALSPVEGMAVFNSTDATWQVYQGAAWVNLLSVAGGDITAVVAGTDLTGGATSGSATVSLNDTLTQAFVFTGATKQDVADTTELTALSAGVAGFQVRLRELASGAGVGGGLFILGDSTFQEGVVAFNSAITGKQWVRAEWLKNPGTVNVKWAGATGDGVTDDRVAIQNALDMVQGTVFMPPGTYSVTLGNSPVDGSYHPALRIRSNTMLLGSGRNTTIIKLAASQLSSSPTDNSTILQTHNIATGDSNIVISDLTIDGNGANQDPGSAQGGISIFKSFNASISRVTVKNCRGSAQSGYGESFHFDINSSSNVVVTEVDVFGNIDSTASGFSSNIGQGIRFVNCTVHGMTIGSGFTAWTVRDLQYTNCWSYDNGAYGFNLEEGREVVYVNCLAGGKTDSTGTGAQSFPLPYMATMGNLTGFVAAFNSEVQYIGCTATYNTGGLSANLSSSARILGGDYSYNVYGIGMDTTSMYLSQITGQPRLYGNTTPLSLATGWATVIGAGAVSDLVTDSLGGIVTYKIRTTNLTADSIYARAYGNLPASSGAPISDVAYSAAWNGDADSAASRNAIYDKIETIAAGGEVNTASNLGGGLANWDSKSVSDLRFNSFDALDFNLASNLIGIDSARWATQYDLTLISGTGTDSALAVGYGIDRSTATNVVTLSADTTELPSTPYKMGLKLNASDTTSFSNQFALKQNADADLDDLADGTLTGSKVESAGASTTGVVNQTTQTFAGVKTFSSDPLIPDEAYGAGWNGVLEPPTKNAVYDQVELKMDKVGFNDSLAASVAYFDTTGMSVLTKRVLTVNATGDTIKVAEDSLAAGGSGTDSVFIAGNGLGRSTSTNQITAFAQLNALGGLKFINDSIGTNPYGATLLSDVNGLYVDTTLVTGTSYKMGLKQNTISFGTGVETWLGTPTTANFLAAISDEGAGGTYLNANGTWTTPGGSGTVTHTGGALTLDLPLLGAGGDDIKTSTAANMKTVLSLNNVTNESKATMFTSPTFTGTVTIPTPFTIGAISMTSTGTQLNILNAATTGDIIQASATNTWAKLASVATGNALISGGVGTANSWGKIGLTTHVSGTLPVANGGTGITSLGAGVATWLGTPTTANFISAISDEGAGGTYLNANGTWTTPAGSGDALRADTLTYYATPTQVRDSILNLTGYNEATAGQFLKQRTVNPDTITGFTPGTGVETALGVNVGSAGAFVTFNGAGGTPSSLTLTNATGLPGTGINSGSVTVTQVEAELKTGQFNFTILDTVKTTGETVWATKIPYAVTITQVSAYTDANTVTFQLEERVATTPNTTGTTVMTSSLVADTDQQTTTSFTNAGQAANTWLTAVVSAAGDVSRFVVTIWYTID